MTALALIPPIAHLRAYTFVLFLVVVLGTAIYLPAWVRSGDPTSSPTWSRQRTASAGHTRN
jgi:hypothetical protein